MSVDRRMRADMQAMGQAVTPDTWAALEEVKQMADNQRKRRNLLLALAAAIVVLVGIAVVPALGDWWQTSDPAPAGQDTQGAEAVDPRVEALLDDFYAAVEAADTQAVLDLLTDDAMLFEQPVADTAEAGLDAFVARIAEEGQQRADLPAYVVDDGFDHAIAWLGTDEGQERLFIARARLVGDALKIYEIYFIK